MQTSILIAIVSCSSLFSSLLIVSAHSKWTNKWIIQNRGIIFDVPRVSMKPTANGLILHAPMRVDQDQLRVYYASPILVTLFVNTGLYRLSPFLTKAGFSYVTYRLKKGSIIGRRLRSFMMCWTRSGDVRWAVRFGKCAVRSHHPVYHYQKSTTLYESRSNLTPVSNYSFKEII